MILTTYVPTHRSTILPPIYAYIFYLRDWLYEIMEE